MSCITVITLPPSTQLTLNCHVEACAGCSNIYSFTVWLGVSGTKVERTDWSVWSCTAGSWKVGLPNCWHLHFETLALSGVYTGLSCAADSRRHCQHNCFAYITAYNSSLCIVLKNSYIILCIYMPKTSIDKDLIAKLWVPQKFPALAFSTKRFQSLIYFGLLRYQ